MSTPAVATWMETRQISNDKSSADTVDLLIRCVHGFITERDQLRLTVEHQKELIDDTMYGIVTGAGLSLRIPFERSNQVANVEMNSFGELSIELTEGVRNSTEFSNDSHLCNLIERNNNDWHHDTEFKTSLITKFIKPVYIMIELMHPEREYRENELEMYADRIETMCERDSTKLLVVGDYLSPIIKDLVKQSRNNQHISFKHYHYAYYKILTQFEIRKLCRYICQQIRSWNLYYGKYYKPTLDTSFIEDDAYMLEAVMCDVANIEKTTGQKCVGIYGNVGRVRKNIRRNKELLKKRLRYWSIRDPEFKYTTETKWYENGRSAILVFAQ